MDKGADGVGGRGDVEERLPSRIDRYIPLKKLATGGMAELFLAKQSGLEGFEKVVVIKQILSHLSQDEEFVAMFLDEARIAAKLSHPNIVQIYDLGKSGDSYYIAMEYVSGRNIQHLITKATERNEAIPTEHVCRIIAGMCDGLYYAHSRKDYDGTPLNIVHRDISPQNVLVSFAGGVKLVDFGIAKASTQLAQTRAGVLKGKYAYMSPEQVRGAKIDQRSDLFAVGLVMYEMLTGHRAFERENSLKTLKAIVQEKPLNPKELNPAIPDPVVKLLSRALEKNPDRRYATAQDMQLAIEDYLETSPKKSNNVRISRFMYEIFDDELNAEGGTMVVQGIGEVIIPTGVKGGLRPRLEEEIDHKTLSAALLPGGDGQEAKGPSAKAPSAKVVHDEKKAPRNEKPAPPPPANRISGLDSIDDDDLASDEESGDDKTIPVYDLEQYEKERDKRTPDKGKSRQRSEDETAGGLSPLSVSVQEKQDATKALGETDEVPKSMIDDAKNAAKHIADDKSEDMTATISPDHGYDPSRDDFMSVTNEIKGAASGPTGNERSDWESGTVELGGTQLEDPPNTGPEELYSSEAVVGPNGVIPTDDFGVRPAAAAVGQQAGIRPAGAIRAAPTPGAPVARQVQERQPTPNSDQTPVTRPAPPAPGAPSPPAQTSRATAGVAQKNKTQTLLLAALGAAVVLLLATFVLIAAIIYQMKGDPAGAPSFVQVEIQGPADAELSIDNKQVKGFLHLVMPGKHLFKLSKQGYTSQELELEVQPPGPLVHEFVLEKSK